MESILDKDETSYISLSSYFLHDLSNFFNIQKTGKKRTRLSKQFGRTMRMFSDFSGITGDKMQHMEVLIWPCLWILTCALLSRSLHSETGAVRNNNSKLLVIDICFWKRKYEICLKTELLQELLKETFFLALNDNGLIQSLFLDNKSPYLIETTPNIESSLDIDIKGLLSLVTWDINFHASYRSIKQDSSIRHTNSKCHNRNILKYAFTLCKPLLYWK